MAKRRDSKSRPGGSSPSAPVDEDRLKKIDAGRDRIMNIFRKTSGFLGEVKTELGKVSWSTRQEIMGATVVVISITAIMAVFIGIVDLFLSKILSMVFK